MTAIVCALALSAAPVSAACPNGFTSAGLPTWQETEAQIKEAFPRGGVKLRGSNGGGNWSTDVCFFGHSGEGNFNFSPSGRLVDFSVRFDARPVATVIRGWQSAVDEVKVLRGELEKVLGKPIERPRSGPGTVWTWETPRLNAVLLWVPEPAHGGGTVDGAPFVLTLRMEDPSTPSTPSTKW